MGNNGRHDARQVGDQTRHDTDGRRVPVLVAAQLLGITPDAVRARLRRGTLPKETGPDGETLVVLKTDTTGDTTRQNTDTTTDTTRHDGRPVGDTMRHDADSTALFEALQAHIAVLERELEDRKEEARR